MLIALAALIQARLRDVSIAIDTVVVKQQTRLIQDKGDSWKVLKSFPTFFVPNRPAFSFITGRLWYIQKQIL